MQKWVNWHACSVDEMVKIQNNSFIDCSSTFGFPKQNPACWLICFKMGSYENTFCVHLTLKEQLTGFIIVTLWNSHCTRVLTHWGGVTHKCDSKLTIIGSDNGLSPGRRQAFIYTNAGVLLIGPLGKNLSEIVIEIVVFSFKEMQLKLSSAKWRPFCLGLNVLKAWFVDMRYTRLRGACWQACTTVLHSI